MTTSVGCMGRRPWPSRAMALASRTTALSGSGIEPCPGEPSIGRAHPAHALLGDLDRIEGAPEEVERERPDLAEHVLCTHFVGVLVAEEHAAELAAGLLVGDAGEDHVARELLAVLRVAREHRHDARAHRGHVLHVDRAAAPHVAVVDLAAERIVLPRCRVGLDDVEVRVEEQRRLRAVALRRARPRSCGSSASRRASARGRRRAGARRRARRRAARCRRPRRACRGSPSGCG